MPGSREDFLRKKYTDMATPLNQGLGILQF